MLVRVRKIANGFTLVSDGQIMYKSEIESALFCRAIMPELPKGK